MNQIKLGPVILGALMAVGSLLPWARAGFISLSGTDGDGIITLIGGVVVFALALAKRSGPIPGIITGLIGVLGTWITWNIFNSLNTGDTQISGGLYLTLIASFLTIFAGIDVARTGKPAAPTPQTGVSTPTPPTAPTNPPRHVAEEPKNFEPPTIGP